MAEDLYVKVLKALHPIANRSREDAEDAYRCLCNVIWVPMDSKFTSYEDCDFDMEKSFSMSWRSAGQEVADLRGEGEDYIDFYCSGREGSITDEIKEAMKVVGLKPLVASGWQ